VAFEPGVDQPTYAPCSDVTPWDLAFWVRRRSSFSAAPADWVGEREMARRRPAATAVALMDLRREGLMGARPFPRRRLALGNMVPQPMSPGECFPVSKLLNSMVDNFGTAA
jgi:hypothetical protein